MTYLEIVPKWTQLSIRKYFQERTENVPVYFEEVPKLRPKQESGVPQIGVELRIDGPFVEYIGTKREVELQWEVNALITWAYDERDTTGLIKLTGLVASVLSQDICVYKMGKTSYDTQAFYDTLRYMAEDRTEVTNFGQIDAVNRIYQSSVEGHYKMRIMNGTI